MATQPRLLPQPPYHLDRSSREAGRRGLAKARAALAEAVAQSAAVQRADHATAA